MTRHRSRYEKVFAETYGPGPYLCHFCQQTVELGTHAIHHLDHNEENDAPDNLVPAHGSCHNSYHFRHLWATQPELMTANNPGHSGHLHSDETKRRISEMKRGVPQDPKVVARIADKNRGKTRSEQFKQAASERARSRTPEHQAKLNSAHIGQKRSPEAREKMRQAALARCARQKIQRDAARAAQGGGQGD